MEDFAGTPRSMRLKNRRTLRKLSWIYAEIVTSGPNGVTDGLSGRRPFTIDQTGHETRAEAVVDVYHRDVRRT